MIWQLVVGSILILISIVIHASAMAYAVRTIQRHRAWLHRRPHFPRLVAALGGVSIWLLTSMTCSVWIWAIYFLLTGALKDLETSVYFSLVSFTTLGFGDIVLDKGHRLLSGMLAANGLILFGLTTAFLIEFLQRLHQAQADSLMER